MEKHTIRAFDADLHDLGRAISEMGGRACQQVADAVDALVERDSELAVHVKTADAAIDDLQHAIEEKGIVTIARRQPTAVDLREIVGALRICNDLERIGDLAANIAKLKRKVMEVKQRYDSSTLLIEDSPISRGLIQSLREQSINVTKYKPDTDKRARVIAQTDLFAGGSVRLPQRAAWLEEFTAELLAFPGRHDDQVDALTQGLAWGRQKRGEVSVSFARGLY